MHDPCFQRVYSLEYLASAVFLALLVNSLERLPEVNSFVRPRLLEVFLDLLDRSSDRFTCVQLEYFALRDLQLDRLVAPFLCHVAIPLF